MNGPTGTHIDAATLRALEKRLRARFASLREEIRADLLRTDDERYVAIADQVRDAGDDAFADLIVDLNLAEIDRDLGELRDIGAALSRIAGNSYGYCGDCGDTIAPARLQALPAASRCTACQERVERRATSPPTPSL
jgi:RNA polymerase-binding transcription factor DksA